MNPVYSVIVPCYNEEDCIGETHRRLGGVMQSLGQPYEILYVNDGSRDGTAKMFDELAARDKAVRVIHFARNAGHQAAVSAGLDYAKGEALIIIDADLQDPPEVIPQMIERWKAGARVVYGQRRARAGEGRLKLLTAKWYYRLLNSLAGGAFPRDTGDFRLVDRQVAEVIKAMPEHARYLRGMFAWAGFEQEALLYDRDARFAGKTHYSLRKMLRLAANGVLSFSEKPLLWPLWAGLVWLGVAVVMLIKAAVFSLLGWSNAGLLLPLVICLGVGMVLASLGILGAYLARVYEEVKGRPLYVVAATRGFEQAPPPLDRAREKA